MAKAKKKYPDQRFAIDIPDDDNNGYLVSLDTIEECLAYDDTGHGKEIEIAVYKLEKVIKVKMESSYKIVG